MRKIILFLLIFYPFAFAGAQQQQVLQERSYWPNGNSKYITGSAPDGQGNILLAGTEIVGVYRFNSSFLLARPNADTLWTRKGPDNLSIEIQGIKKVRNNGYIFYASKSGSGNITGTLLQRLTPAAQPAWTKTHFAGSTDNIPSSVLIMPDKGYLLGGYFGINGQTRNFAFTRTDSAGNILWKKHYTRSNQDALVDMQFTANGNILAVGTTSNPVGPRHLKLLLLNQLGDSVAGRQLVVNCFNCVEDIMHNLGKALPLSDGGFLINAAVDTTVGTTNTDRGMLVKVDANLNIVWKYVHRTPALPIEGYQFTGMKELADHSILVLGFKFRPFGAHIFQLYRFSPLGQLTYVYVIQSSICNEVSGVTLDALTDSTFMIGGRCVSGSNYSMYVAAVKIPGLPPVLPPVQPIVNATQPDLALQATALGQSYPNPAQDETIIPYTLPTGTKSAKILLTDLTGREVGSYPLKVQQEQGSLPVNLSRLRNGLYLYTLVLDGRTVATKKLAVAR